jgi:hypothetical protein
MTSTKVLPVLVAALTLGACGTGEEEGGEARPSEKEAPAEAVREIGAVRDGLDLAVRQLREGDRRRAEDTVAETYVTHFEKVEGPLEKVDHELNEELEEAISQELRDEIRSGASVSSVSGMVQDVKGDLAVAERKLG